MKGPTIIFIHGMSVNSTSWDNWIEYYSTRGYDCVAPDWPYHDKTVTELRTGQPDSGLGTLTMEMVLEKYRTIIEPLTEKPILIGHSMGGLIVQKLLSEGHGLCGIAIGSFPPVGIRELDLSFWRNNFSIVNPLKGDSTYLMSFKEFQQNFVNTLTLREQEEYYDKFIVPESRNVIRSAAKTATLDFNRQRPPLLLIAGSEDRVIPLKTIKKVFDKYRNSSSTTELKEFEGGSIS